MHLPDPRIYPTTHVKNSVIVQLNAVLAENNPQRQQEKQAALEFLLTQYLEQDQQEAIVIALSLVPSQSAYQYLWRTIKSLLMSKEASHQAQIFAIPLVMVAGSHSSMTLPGKLNQIDSVVQSLKMHHIVDKEADIFLGSQLYTGEMLASISLPQLYRWQSALQYASAGLPIHLTSDPIYFVRQGVFLRYLLGIAIRNQHTPKPIQLGGEVGSWGLDVAECIRQDLQQEGLTLFTIPRHPQTLLDALDNGQHIYIDITMQVFLSDTIKKLREQKKTPTASITCHQNHEIKLILSSLEAPEKWESFVWPLQALEYPATIGQQMQDLLRECQVEDVILLTDIQPALENSMPLFITPAHALHYPHITR